MTAAVVVLMERLNVPAKFTPGMFVVTVAVTTPARPPFVTRNTPPPFRMLTNSVVPSPKPMLTLLALMVRIFCVVLMVSCVKAK